MNISKIFPFLLTTSLLFISCASTPLPNTGTVTVPDDFFGLVHAGRLRTAEEYHLLNELGAVWLLDTFRWNSIEPERGGGYNFSRYEPFVNIANEHGHKVIAVIAYHTSWIAKDSGKIDYIPKRYYDDYLNYVEALIIHFKGRVHAWQIWNEPNWIFWRGPDKEFFELSKLAAQRIKDTDPDAYIIGGGFFRVPESFIMNMYKAGALENLNAISFHPYGAAPRGSAALHDNFLRIMSKLNYKGDIWITEAGYPTGGFYPSSVSLKEFPSYIIKTIAGSAARGAKVLIWYQLFDRHLLGEAPNKFNSEMFFGLAYRDYTRKDGAWAYQLCSQNLPGSRYMPEMPLRENVPSNIISLCFMGGSSGRNTLILWNDRKNTQKIRVTLSSPVTLNSISSNSNIILEDNSIINVTNTPVFITWEGESTPVITKVNK